MVPLEQRRHRRGAGYPFPARVTWGGGIPALFSWKIFMFTLEIAQQSVLTKIYWGLGHTNQKEFPSGNEGIRDLVVAACWKVYCQQPNYVDMNCRTSDRTKVIEKSAGVVSITKLLQLRFPFFAHALFYS